MATEFTDVGNIEAGSLPSTEQVDQISQIIASTSILNKIFQLAKLNYF